MGVLVGVGKVAHVHNWPVPAPAAQTGTLADTRSPSTICRSRQTPPRFHSSSHSSRKSTRDVVIKSNLDWILFVAGDYKAKECCATCFYQGDVIQAQCYGQATEDEWLDSSLNIVQPSVLENTRNTLLENVIPRI